MIPTLTQQIQETKEQRYDNLYMDIVDRLAQMSYAQRKKVGCLIIKDGRILSMGWNGMPSGWNNICEHLDEEVGLVVTNDEVLHAEANALSKVSKSHESTEHAIMYVNCSPCMECAKMIYQSGIVEVVYKNRYYGSKGDGVPFLIKSGVKIREL